MRDIKYCRDCKWSVIKGDNEYRKTTYCTHPELIKITPAVLAANETDYTFTGIVAEFIRRDTFMGHYHKCGLKGRLWEEKEREPVWTKKDLEKFET